MLENAVKKLSSRTGLRLEFMSGFAWNHAAKISEYFLLYVFSVIVARTLGPEANGIYATLISISQLLLTLSSVALDLTLNRFLQGIAEPHAEAKITYLVRKLLLVKLALFSLFSFALIANWELIRLWFYAQSPVTG